MGIDSNFELEARPNVSVVVLLSLLGPLLNGCAVMSVPVMQPKVEQQVLVDLYRVKIARVGVRGVQITAFHSACCLSPASERSQKV